MLPGIHRRTHKQIRYGPPKRPTSQKPWVITHLHRPSDTVVFFEVPEEVSPLERPSESETGVFASLPPELIILVTEFLLDHWTTPSEPFFEIREDLAYVTKFRDIEAQSRLCDLIQLNKHWFNALIPLLYWRPVISSPRSLRKFAKLLLNDSPTLSSHVKGLILIDRTSEDDTESFYGVAYCGTPDVRKETQDALISIMACREPGALNVIFVTKHSPILDSCGQGVSLLGWSPKSKQSMLASSVSNNDAVAQTACTALASLHSLTLHGFASHLLYTPSSDWFDTTSMAFSSLQSLTLDSLCLKELHWPYMPALDTLTIMRCRTSSYSLPSPVAAPKLRTIAVSDGTSCSDTRNPPALVPFLLPHGPTLFSLTLDFAVYEHILKLTDFAGTFSVLRELAVHKAPFPFGWQPLEEPKPWTEGILPKRIPPALGILRIAGPILAASSEDVLIAFTPEYGGRILAPDTLERRLRGMGKWKELRVVGTETFWDTVPRLYTHAAEALCKSANVEYQCEIEEHGEYEFRSSVR
jgi:hypothetical protein